MRCRRAILTLLVFVLLGTVATVLSSWAIHAVQFWRLHQGSRMAYGWTRVLESDFPLAGPTRDATLDAWDGFRVLPEDSSWNPKANAHHERPVRRNAWAWRATMQRLSIFDLDPADSRSTVEFLCVFDVGWPAAAARCGSYTGRFLGRGFEIDRTRTRPVSLHGGVEVFTLPSSTPTVLTWQAGAQEPLYRFALPLLPLWPGFLINTLFYALLLFLAWRTPIFARRTLPRRRGRCVGCGYDREGLGTRAACPECGASVGHGARGAAVAG